MEIHRGVTHCDLMATDESAWNSDVRLMAGRSLSRPDLEEMHGVIMSQGGLRAAD
jgi:hypothetical protein